MIVYFTGTGNSRYCAQLLAHRLDDTCIDSTPFIRDGIAAELSSQKPWVFVAPTYSWRLPRVFVSFLESGRFSGSREVYWVMTCGSDIGKSPVYNHALSVRMGLHDHGTLPVVMPENYIALFSTPGPEEAKSILQAARPVMEEGARRIGQGLDFPPVKPRALDGLKSGIVNTLFYRFNVKANPFTVSNACISCGTCETSCPLGNIHLEEGRPVWGATCTHCMACICSCPVEAIEYGTSSRGKPRYQCPPYRG